MALVLARARPCLLPLTMSSRIAILSPMPASMPVATARTIKKSAKGETPLLDTQAMTSFDTLSYAKVLQQGGVPTKQAEAMATGLLQYLKNEVATKSDIILLRSDVASFKAEVKSDVALFKAEIKDDLASFKTEVKEDIVMLKAEVAAIKTSLKIIYWVLGVLVILQVSTLGFVFSLFSLVLALP